MVVWGLSGGAARAIGLFEAANVCMQYGQKPNAIIGTSSGALLAPIIAVAYEYPPLMEQAIKFAQTLDPSDMFPYKNNYPLKKNGKPSTNALFRIMTGWNHLAWQDIAPLYKKLFKDGHFDLLKQSDIKCYSFGVIGKNGKPDVMCLNDAKDLDDMISSIKKSARIVPVVQNEQGYIDGGFISFNPSSWLFDKYDITQLVSIYSKELKHEIQENNNWDKNVISVIFQALQINAHWIGVKDREIEELYCQLNGIDYIPIECPNGYTDELYESDDEQLIALGEASREAALKAWNEKLC